MDSLIFLLSENKDPQPSAGDRRKILICPKPSCAILYELLQLTFSSINGSDLWCQTQDYPDNHLQADFCITNFDIMTAK